VIHSLTGYWPLRREVIGPPECPLLHRWTLLNLGPRVGKLMVHRFLPNADDRAVHDHPRPFLTFVLRGAYDDMAPCPFCAGEARWRVCALCKLAPPMPGRTDVGLPVCSCRSMWLYGTEPRWEEKVCGICDGDGVTLRETMRAGMVRYRAAEHRHRTRVHSSGAWTIVAMGALQREWGFFKSGVWMPWREFERRFGHGMRCGDE
jgi:hypothetical protein